MCTYTIKELEQLSGVKAHTIRVWEQRYNFLKPQRTTTNIRYYCNDELKKLLTVSLLNKYGYKISHLSVMTQEEIDRSVSLLDEGEAVEERDINELIFAMTAMDMEQLNELWKKQVESAGLEETVLRLLIPFLERVGLFSAEGAIHPAHEHLISSFFSQKMIAAIATTIPPSVSGKKVLFFQPEGEYNELGLLLSCFLVKNRGAQTIYIGANTPLGDVEEILKFKEPDIIITHLIKPHTSASLKNLFGTLKTKIKTSGKLIVSGRLPESYQVNLPVEVEWKAHINEVIDCVSDN